MNDERNESSSSSSSGGGLSLAEETIFKKGSWKPWEDAILVEYVQTYGEGNWATVSKRTGLPRCGKSCRLRWLNHLKSGLRKGPMTREEDEMIVRLHSQLGNKWAEIARSIPGRTSNDIKNHWHTRVKRLQRAGLFVHPAHVRLQNDPENQQTQNDNRVRGPSEVLQSGIHDSGRHFMANPEHAAYSPQSSDFSLTGLQSGALSPHTLSFKPGLNQSYFPGNHGGMARGHGMFAQQVHYDPAHAVNTNVLSLGHSEPSSFIPPDANFSTSRPSTGTVRLELPSLQYPETNYGRQTCPPPPPCQAIHISIRPPPIAVSTPSDPASQSSGLLETIIQESHTRSTVGEQSSENRSNSSPDLSSINWDLPEFSPFSDCAPTDDIFFDGHLDFNGTLGLEKTEPSAEQTSTPDVVEKDVSDGLNVPSTDASSGSDWYTGDSQKPQ